MPDDDQDSGVSSLPVDPTTGVPVLTIGPPASNPLPVEQQPIYDPYTGVSLDQDASVTDTGPIAKLFGLAGNDRYQLWPERVVRSALSAPADALAGKFSGVVTPDTNGLISDEDIAAAQASAGQEIPRALDVASLAGVGGVGPVAEAPVAAAPVSDSVGTIAPLLKEFDMAAQPVLRSDTTQPAAAIDAAANVPTFYSAVENAVNNASIKSASPQQWLGTIQNAKGVKPEELQWTGLQDWLADQPGPVSKQDVQSYLNTNKVQLNEVQKGQTINGIEARQLATNGENIYTNTGTGPLETNQIMPTGNYLRSATGTKFQQYQLPGAEPNSYREMLMTLPVKSKRMEMRVEADRRGYPNRIADWPDQQFADEYRKHVTNNADPEYYKSSHWDEPNVLAHVRMNDRTIDGKKALHLEEIQSDFLQAHRKEALKIKEGINKDFDGIADKMIKDGLIKKICD